jgi:3-oxoacyl-[acyl-carrier protein] reductase
MKLQGAVIAITGGGQGLGRSMAVYLAQQGAKIALIDMNQEKLDETRTLCEEAGSSANTYLCNVTQEDQVIDCFKSIGEDFSTLDGLINNAGILRDGLFIKAKDGKVINKMSLAQWQAVIDVNLTGVFLCGREAAALMIEKQSQGCIINISSIARAGNFGQTNYSAAKAGVVAMMVTWASELARFGIRTAAIAPGFIATDMTASMKPEALEAMTQHIPLKKMGQPEDIAKAASFILESDYLTGRVIEVDGGIRL